MVRMLIHDFASWIDPMSNRTTPNLSGRVTPSYAPLLPIVKTLVQLKVFICGRVGETNHPGLWATKIYFTLGKLVRP